GGIREGVVRLLHLVEARGGIGILVDIRVIAPGQLAVGGPDLISGGAAGDAERFVIVALAVAHGLSPHRRAPECSATTGAVVPGGLVLVAARGLVPSAL